MSGMNRKIDIDTDAVLEDWGVSSIIVGAEPTPGTMDYIRHEVKRTKPDRGIFGMIADRSFRHLEDFMSTLVNGAPLLQDLVPAGVGAVYALALQLELWTLKMEHLGCGSGNLSAVKAKARQDARKHFEENKDTFFQVKVN